MMAVDVVILSYNYTKQVNGVIINVEDTIAPVITLNGDANITHEAGFVYVDANASWTDAVDGSGSVACDWRSQCKQARHL